MIIPLEVKRVLLENRVREIEAWFSYIEKHPKDELASKDFLMTLREDLENVIKERRKLEGKVGDNIVFVDFSK